MKIFPTHHSFSYVLSSLLCLSPLLLVLLASLLLAKPLVLLSSAMVLLTVRGSEGGRCVYTRAGRLVSTLAARHANATQAGFELSVAICLDATRAS